MTTTERIRSVTLRIRELRGSEVPLNALAALDDLVAIVSDQQRQIDGLRASLRQRNTDAALRELERPL